jgi:hypothetical protein
MYNWVSGGLTNDGSVRKYHRAVETLRKEGKEMTEEAVKALYIKFGGLVIEDSEEPEEVVVEVKKKGKK